jgi:solute carrier family 35, member E1
MTMSSPSRRKLRVVASRPTHSPSPSSSSSSSLSSSSSSSSSSPLSSSSNSVFVIVCLFIGWAAFSTFTDTLNKAILNVFAFPITLTLCHFGISAVCGLLFLPGWSHIQRTFGALQNDSSNSTSLHLATLVQTFGFFLTNLSFGRVAIAFTQTVKASAPLFSLAIQRVFLGRIFSMLTYVSLIPIVAGVAITATTELSFDKWGFLAAIGSNICFSSRSIVAKPLFAKVGNATLYFHLSLRGFLLLLPIWSIFEAPSLYSTLTVNSAASQSASDSLESILSMSLVYKMIACSVFHFAYNQISFSMLARVSPLTHAVCNVARRAAVIVFTMIAFSANPSIQNIAGITTVFVGVGGYMLLQHLTQKSGTSIKSKDD